MSRIEMEKIFYETNVPPPGTDLDQKLLVQVDETRCIGCDTCMGYCPTGAISGESGEPHKVVDAAACINCGQCLTHCPTAAIYETVSFVPEIEARLKDKNVKVIAMPPRPCATPGRPVRDAARGRDHRAHADGPDPVRLRPCLGQRVHRRRDHLGRGSELLARITKKLDKPLPQFHLLLSRLAEIRRNLLPGTAAPLLLLQVAHRHDGPAAKTYGAKELGYDPKTVYTVSIMPCTAKKFEGMRPEYHASGYRDIDATINTRELASMLKKAGIDLPKIAGGRRDALMGESTGGATIFGVSGGVMEAALRFAYQALTKKPPESWISRPCGGWTASRKPRSTSPAPTSEWPWSTAGKNFAKVCEQVKAGKSPYHFVEFMACPGGCVMGGGQPIMPRSSSPWTSARPGSTPRSKSAWPFPTPKSLRRLPMSLLDTTRRGLSQDRLRADRRRLIGLRLTGRAVAAARQLKEYMLDRIDSVYGADAKFKIRASQDNGRSSCCTGSSSRSRCPTSPNTCCTRPGWTAPRIWRH